MLKNYKELKVWEKSYQFCLEIYRLTQEFPKSEIYGLISQMRRAALSIPSNIAEGYGRKTTPVGFANLNQKVAKGDRPEYLRSLYIDYGSVCELETQVLISGDLGYLKGKNLPRFQEDLKEIERMLKALIKSLENNHLNP
jgi:hypothetical protein